MPYYTMTFHGKDESFTDSGFYNNLTHAKQAASQMSYDDTRKIEVTDIEGKIVAVKRYNRWGNN